MDAITIFVVAVIMHFTNAGVIPTTENLPTFGTNEYFSNKYIDKQFKEISSLIGQIDQGIDNIAMKVHSLEVAETQARDAKINLHFLFEDVQKLGICNRFTLKLKDDITDIHSLLTYLTAKLG